MSIAKTVLMAALLGATAPAVAESEDMRTLRADMQEMRGMMERIRASKDAEERHQMMEKHMMMMRGGMEKLERMVKQGEGGHEHAGQGAGGCPMMQNMHEHMDMMHNMMRQMHEHRGQEADDKAHEHGDKPGGH